MHSFGSRFGLGQLTGIDLPSERRGIWPSREWKRGARGSAWFPGDNLNMAIGQGYALTTPLQLAVSTATLANRGKRMLPQVVRSVGGVERPPIVADYLEVDDKHWEFMLSAMENTVHSQRGTARRIAAGADYRMAGKTGPARVVATAQDERSQSYTLYQRQRHSALLVCYERADDPQIPLAVTTETVEPRATVATLIARKAFDVYRR